MKNNEFVNMLSGVITTNKVMTLFALNDVDYDFNKEITEQSTEVVEKVFQMVLNKLTAPVNNDVEVVSEVLQVESEIVTQEPHQEEPQVDLIIDDRELQLMELFNESKTIPSKRKDKKQLTESILNILIPKSSKNTLKGRILRDTHKRNHVTQLINNSNDREQLTNDLISWIDDFSLKASKRI